MNKIECENGRTYKVLMESGTFKKMWMRITGFFSRRKTVTTIAANIHRRRTTNKTIITITYTVTYSNRTRATFSRRMALKVPKKRILIISCEWVNDNLTIIIEKEVDDKTYHITSFATHTKRITPIYTSPTVLW